MHFGLLIGQWSTVRYFSQDVVRLVSSCFILYRLCSVRILIGYHDLEPIQSSIYKWNSDMPQEAWKLGKNIERYGHSQKWFCGGGSQSDKMHSLILPHETIYNYIYPWTSLIKRGHLMNVMKVLIISFYTLTHVVGCLSQDLVLLHQPR